MYQSNIWRPKSMNFGLSSLTLCFIICNVTAFMVWLTWDQWVFYHWRSNTWNLCSQICLLSFDFDCFWNRNVKVSTAFFLTFLKIPLSDLIWHNKRQIFRIYFKFFLDKYIVKRLKLLVTNVWYHNHVFFIEIPCYL